MNKTMERTETLRDLQAEKHNAQIRERFRELQQAQESQFDSVLGISGAPSFSAPQASVIAPERPQVATELFTPATLDRVIEQNNTVAVEEIARTPVQAEIAAHEEQFTVSRLAKVVAAAFAVVVTAMLAVICVNTQVIHQKTERLSQLEQQKYELAEQNAEIQERIKAARSEETIREFASQYNAAN